MFTTHRFAKLAAALAAMTLLLSLMATPSQARETYEPLPVQYTPQVEVGDGTVTVTWRYVFDGFPVPGGVDPDGVPYTITKFTVRALDLPASGVSCESGAPGAPPCVPTGGDICTASAPFTPVGAQQYACTGPAPDPTTIPGGVELGVAFTVLVENSGGFVSAWSMPSLFTPVPVPPTPGVPSGVQGTPGNGSVTVTWTAPSPGDGPITGYIVEYSDDGGQTWSTASCPGTGTSCLVPGLINGTSYLFRVSATNEFGTGGTSASSQPVIPREATPPGPATNVVATPANGGAVVRWDRPNDDGGSPLTGVTVEHSSDGGATWLASTCANADPLGDSRCDVTGLNNGSEYIFRVRLANAAGEGDVSVASAGVTPSRDAGIEPRFAG